MQRPCLTPSDTTSARSLAFLIFLCSFAVKKAKHFGTVKLALFFTFLEEFEFAHHSRGRLTGDGFNTSKVLAAFAKTLGPNIPLNYGFVKSRFKL